MRAPCGADVNYWSARGTVMPTLLATKVGNFIKYRLLIDVDFMTFPHFAAAHAECQASRIKQMTNAEDVTQWASPDIYRRAKLYRHRRRLKMSFCAKRQVYIDFSSMVIGLIRHDRCVANARAMRFQAVPRHLSVPRMG